MCHALFGMAWTSRPSANVKASDTAGSPTRRRAQTWRSFFIAPRASLFLASRTLARFPRSGHTPFAIPGRGFKSIQLFGFYAFFL
jgi:hypothetical protein